MCEYLLLHCFGLEENHATIDSQRIRRSIVLLLFTSLHFSVPTFNHSFVHSGRRMPGASLSLHRIPQRWVWSGHHLGLPMPHMPCYFESRLLGVVHDSCDMNFPRHWSLYGFPPTCLESRNKETAHYQLTGLMRLALVACHQYPHMF